ncbi:hypothetical protein GNX14_17160 [Mesorhizobium japonicum]|nr:hypothetical protein [Mesorhizobium japonicum]
MASRRDVLHTIEKRDEFAWKGDCRPAKGDQLRHRGQTYPMTQHGFARDKAGAFLPLGRLPTVASL